MDMPSRTDRTIATRPPVAGPRLPARLRIRRPLTIPPEIASRADRS